MQQGAYSSWDFTRKNTKIVVFQANSEETQLYTYDGRNEYRDFNGSVHLVKDAWIVKKKLNCASMDQNVCVYKRRGILRNAIYRQHRCKGTKTWREEYENMSDVAKKTVVNRSGKRGSVNTLNERYSSPNEGVQTSKKSEWILSVFIPFFASQQELVIFLVAPLRG